MCRRRTIFFPSTVKVSKTSLSIGTFHRAFTNKTSSKLDTCSEFSSIGSWSRLIFDTLSIRHGVESPQKTSLLRVPKPLKSKTNLMRLPLSWSLTLRRWEVTKPWDFWNGQAARGGQSFRNHPRQSLQRPLLLLVETWLPQQISTKLRLKSDWKKTCSFFCGGPASEVFFWTANFIKFRALQGVTTNTTETNTFLERCHQETCITLGANFLTCHIVNIDTPLVKRTWGSPVSSKDVGVPLDLSMCPVEQLPWMYHDIQWYNHDIAGSQVVFWNIWKCLEMFLLHSLSIQVVWPSVSCHAGSIPCRWLRLPKLLQLKLQ